MAYASLYIYHLCYFSLIGISTFLSKYYGEIGMTEGQIGLLMGIPTVVAILVAPRIGVMTDRVSQKRNLLTGLLAIMAAVCFVVNRVTAFAPLIVAVSVYTCVSNAVTPIGTTISLEYTRSIQKPYGPVRLVGTVGYQLGVLAVGLILKMRLSGLYAMMGVALILSVVASRMMPDVAGHQHNQPRIPMRRLFEDRTLRLLYGLLFISATTTQFYASFFTKYLGDLGLENVSVSLITILTVATELPFLAFADRIYKKLKIWRWIQLGFLLNGLRFIGFFFFRSIGPLLLLQIPAVSVLACFEFFPSLFLAGYVPAEQIGTANSLHTLTIFGAGLIVGTIIGGQLAEHIGIPSVFLICGLILLSTNLLLAGRISRLCAPEAAR